MKEELVKKLKNKLNTNNIDKILIVTQLSMECFEKGIQHGKKIREKEILKIINKIEKRYGKRIVLTELINKLKKKVENENIN